MREGRDVAADPEIRAAALQYVRKVSGFRQPSARHQEAFEAAVDEIAESSRQLLEAIAQGMATPTAKV